MIFTIDDKLRTITIPNNGSVFGVSGDIEVNQVEFQMPRYCAGESVWFPNPRDTDAEDEDGI